MRLGMLATIAVIGLAASAHALQWVSEGPAGGTVSAIGVHPHDPQTAYAASGARLFKTVDGGAHWTRLDPGILLGVIQVIIVDPVDPAIVWLGGNRDGVLRSTDAGATFAPAGTGLRVNDIALDPDDHTVAYAATDAGFFRSEHGAPWLEVPSQVLGVRRLLIDARWPHPWYSLVEPGLLYRSLDRGVTWEQPPFEFNAGKSLALAVEPGAAGKLLVGKGGPGPEGPGGIPRISVWRSAGGDEPWTPMPLQDSALDLAVVASDPPAYFTVGNNGLSRSLDGGQTWEPRVLGDTPYIVRAASVDGAFVYAGTDVTGVEVSHDLGTTWTVGDGFFAQRVAALAVEPGPTPILHAATESGAVFRGPLAHGWTPEGFSRPDPPSGPIRALAWDGGTNTLIAAEANTTWRRSVGGAWIRGGDLPGLHPSSPEGGFVAELAVDPASPGRVFAVHTYLGVLRSEDDGKTWTRWDDSALGAQVVTLAIEPGSPGAVWAGTWAGRPTSYIRRRPIDGGPWANVTSDFPMAPRRITRVVAPGAGHALVASTWGLHRTTNGGASWTPVTVDGGTPTDASALAVDPNDPAHLVASVLIHDGDTSVPIFGWEGQERLVETRDGGDVWSVVGPPLPFSRPAIYDTAVVSLMIGPDGIVYAGTNHDGVLALLPVCGDGQVDDGETCDLGSANGAAGSGCPADCAPPTTTTTTVPACTSGCDDGDACTVDACMGSSCAHESLHGADAAACACTTLAAECPRVPRAIRRLHAGACRLLGGNAVTPRRLVRARARAVRAAQRVERAARNGKLLAPCTEALRRRFGHLTGAIADLTGP